MKCTHCGLPLSPSRTQCPRCGTHSERTSGKIRLTHIESQSSHNLQPPTDAPISIPQDYEDSALSSFNAPANLQQPPYLTEQQVIEPDAGTPVIDKPMLPSSPLVDTDALQQSAQSPLAGEPVYAPKQEQDAMHGQAENNSHSYNQNLYPLPPSDAGNTRPNRLLTSAEAVRGYQAEQSPRTRLGFTIAGSFMATGAIILVVVYIMMQSLAIPVAGLSTALHHTATSSVSAGKPAPQKSQPSTVPPTATSTLLAQQYIDNIHLASKVNVSTGIPEVSNSIFHIGEPVYVTLTLHQPAYNGTVCLTWLLNNQSTPYNTQVTYSSLSQINAYFYFKPGTTGQGAVIVTWASTPDCTNTTPAQRANFTVTV